MLRITSLNFSKNFLNIQTYYFVNFSSFASSCSHLIRILLFIVNKFSMFNIASLSFPSFLVTILLVYLEVFKTSLFLYIFFNVLLGYSSFIKQSLVGSNGIEPSTSRLSGVRSNHLSYEPIFQSSSQVLPSFVSLHSLYQCTNKKYIEK